MICTWKAKNCKWFLNSRRVALPERLERGGPCWLLKLKWMETQRVQMNGVFPFLVVPIQETFILPWLLWSAKYKIFFPHRTQFQFMCLFITHTVKKGLAAFPTPAGMSLTKLSLGWPFFTVQPVSECVSLGTMLLPMTSQSYEDETHLRSRIKGNEVVMSMYGSIQILQFGRVMLWNWSDPLDHRSGSWSFLHWLPRFQKKSFFHG